MKQILIINSCESLEHYAHENGFYSNDIMSLENPSINQIQSAIVENPTIRHIIAPNVSAISGNFAEIDRFIGYCMNNRINITILEPYKMALFNDDGTVGIPFKARVLIDTDFERF